MVAPSTNGSNGLDTSGKFLPGNPGGPGNPHVRRVAKLRSALLDAVTPEDVAAIAKKLVKLAKAGNLAAAKLILDRIGRPDDADDEDALNEGRNRITEILQKQEEANEDAQRAGLADHRGRPRQGD